MSICINNDLIWVSVPRCASTSIEHSILNSPLTINHHRFGTAREYPMHIHVKLSELYANFGKIETVVIKRNYFDRWISTLQHSWYMYKKAGIKMSVNWEDIDNDFIYENFTNEYIDSIYSIGEMKNDLVKYEDIIKMREFNNSIIYRFTKTIPKNIDQTFNPLIILLSQLYWVDNNKCTYEFNIDEIDKFEEFMCDRYNIDFKVDRINKSNPLKNNIVKDEKLKKWVFDNFEKRFETRNQLI
jgi:hypothetical protein